MKCICGHEMTEHRWKGQWVCHRCGRTNFIEEPTLESEFVTRCKNCRNCIDISGTPYCTFWERNTEEDWYCCQGW